MKQTGINGSASSPQSSCAVISAACFALVLSGCISVPNSPTPRFYVLQSVDVNQAGPVRGYNLNEPEPAFNGAGKKINIAAGVFIGVGPVKIPEYQDRPQIVTRSKEKMLNFAQFDRWGESLDFGVMRLIGEELTVMFPGAKIILYPWNSAIPVKYQVVVEIVRLDSELDKELFLVAQWLVIDAQNMKTMIIKRSEFRRPIFPQNYSGLAKTLSTVCVSLSSEIAASLEVILKTKDVPPVPEE